MRLALATLALTLTPALAQAQAASTPGAATSPHPTLEHLSIEWPVSGDTDLDGTVRVRFREVGGVYRDALPLMHVAAGSNEGFSWAHRHAGSIFGLTPDTAYEVELQLTDPDGGNATTTLVVRTRPIPAQAADARIVNVTPSSITAALRAAEPGDVLLLGAGRYSEIIVARSGTAARPIVLRGTDAATVVIAEQVRMDGQSHVHLERVTVEGQVKFNNASNIVVRGCNILAGMGAEGSGIVSYGMGSTDGYFADNVITGRTAWAEGSLGVDGENIGEGIEVTGPGNVIEHNRITGFRDCISLLEDGVAVNQTSVDILRNDLSICADDAIEADFAMGNVRVIGNRMTNSFMAWSAQPSLGGPSYFIRNVSFNGIFQAFKPHRGSIGDYLFHNTVVKPGDAMGVYAGRAWSRAMFRNNLFIGGVGGGDYNGFSNGDGRVLALADADATCDFDYDGLGSHGTGTFAGRIGDARFNSLAELVATGREVHAVQLDTDIFASAFAFPEVPFPTREPVDLRLRGGSEAIDRGQPLANINDGFAGAAPDLGAYELGSGVPLYGPRTGASVCGNGAREPGEQCDDSNTTSGDGCNADCMTEVPPGTDAGPVPDAGPAGPFDAGRDHDAGITSIPEPSISSGCGCRAQSGDTSALSIAMSTLLLGLLQARRQRAPQR